MSSINSSESLAASGGKPSVSHESLPYKTVTYSGEGNEYVIIDNKKYLRHELMAAFGGTFNPGLAPFPKHQFGNASALGIAAFALPLLVLGLYNLQAKDITIPNMIVGLCFFYGGLCQFLSGLWEMVMGNTFAATSFMSYACFWLSYGALLTPSFGILEAYAADPAQAYQAIGLYLIGWTILTAMFLSLTLKSTVSFVGLFLTLLLDFALSAAAYMTGNMTYLKVGGGFGVVCSIFGWYLLYQGVAVKSNAYFTAPALLLPVYGGRFEGGSGH
ncbi:FUN-related protein [Scheffersomyces stipitis CBS 6054]|uniref:FUN-related protein n=1 Tax=Scheffersomyces stipitis (strain ATCC 58785 / CBS 6054 / NBRC 10063 / NRRL Y-11545) TaxID=322104 RepID=A3LT16_PICST|nr:FUN-related protein [Scheffersomyces stipitis CBS 6054]ABN66332.2 FUN-related protein [Scheffersomyces stipitis CBS 6054]KAG2733328.1 hypothetical protein G9P44_004318 [Scheffersomyces stipitis]